MRHTGLIGALTALLWAAAAPAQQQPTQILDPLVALNHVGETAMICGRAASTTMIADQALVVAIDAPYPAQNFSLLIRGVDRVKFGSPEINLRGKKVCSTGVIQMAQGRAQMVLREPGQLAVQ